MAAENRVLLLDHDRPDRAVLWGVDVFLRPIEFRFLRVLALRAGRCVTYDALYETIWGDRVVGEGQLYQHKLSICEKFERVCPGTRGLIRTLHRWGYLLDLRVEEVEVREGALLARLL